MPLLDVEDLSVEYRIAQGSVHAVRGVSLSVDAGGSLGLVGESGCGKSTLARALIRVLPRNARIAGGAVRLEGTNLLELTEEEMNQYRWRKIAVVPQAAMDSLDPVYRVGDQIVETLRLRQGLAAREARDRAEGLFRLVGLEGRRLKHYPHEFSGGMKQRAVIAIALALNPSLLIADEPVTALDVIVQRQVLATLRQLRKEFRLSLILITHDISVVAHLCEDVAVMYAGRVVERGTVRRVLAAPQHPYTMGLRNAFPSLRMRQPRLVPIEGYPPDLVAPPRGCAFAPRCPFVISKCWEEDPPLVATEDGHAAACHRVHEATALRAGAAQAFARLEREAEEGPIRTARPGGLS